MLPMPRAGHQNVKVAMKGTNYWTRRASAYKKLIALHFRCIFNLLPLFLKHQTQIFEDFTHDRLTCSEVYSLYNTLLVEAGFKALFKSDAAKNYSRRLLKKYHVSSTLPRSG